jgi:hypothetical protein
MRRPDRAAIELSHQLLIIKTVPYCSERPRRCVGKVSAGVNFFNPSANTSVFAKLDVTFGDDIDGTGGKAGMRVSW